MLNHLGKRLLLTDLADHDSIRANYNYPSEWIKKKNSMKMKGNDGVPPPSYIGQYNSIVGLAKGMMAFMSLLKKCQDELWVIYRDLPRSNKLNFKKDICRIEKEIITMIDKLLCAPTKGTKSSKGSNVTSSVVPEIRADDESVEEDVFHGLFLDQSTREEIVTKENEKQKKKQRNESSYPARIDNYNANKRSIECTLKESKRTRLASIVYWAKERCATPCIFIFNQ